MINRFLITGDCHGNFTRFKNIDKEKYKPEETAIIILGDAGWDYLLDERDSHSKNKFEKTGFTVYCVRGNHEERPTNLPCMCHDFDENVGNFVYVNYQWPHIRYFIDGAEYEIAGHKTLVVGGAYSVDKYWRLAHYDKDATWTGWFKDEQLTETEMTTIENLVKGHKYDFVFTHTCPLSWQPTDLFLFNLDQSTVENEMEVWMEHLKNEIEWDTWLFAHYHRDRIEGPHIEMFYNDMEDIEDIWHRWHGDEDYFWWLERGPKYDYIS